MANVQRDEHGNLLVREGGRWLLIDAASARAVDAAAGAEDSDTEFPTRLTASSEKPHSRPRPRPVLANQDNTRPIKDEDDFDFRPPRVTASSAARKRVATTDNDERAPGPSKRAKASKAASVSVAQKAPAIGRTTGSHNYSDEELKELLKIVRRVLPTGGSRWSQVHDEYEAWAKNKNYSRREPKPLKARFEKLVNEARRKQTGNAEIPELFHLALLAEQEINERVYLGILDDKPVDVKPVITPGRRPKKEPSFIEIESSSDDGDTNRGETVKKGGDSHPTVTKAYRVAPSSKKALPSSVKPPSARSAGQSSTKNLALQIADAFSPQAREQREGARFQSQLAAGMIASLQTEVTRLREREIERVETIAGLRQEKKVLLMQLQGNGRSAMEFSGWENEDPTDRWTTLFESSGDSNLHDDKFEQGSGHYEVKQGRYDVKQERIEPDAAVNTYSPMLPKQERAESSIDSYMPGPAPHVKQEQLDPRNVSHEYVPALHVKQEYLAPDPFETYAPALPPSFPYQTLHDDHHNDFGATVHENVAGSSRGYGNGTPLPEQSQGNWNSTTSMFGMGRRQSELKAPSAHVLNDLPPLTDILRMPGRIPGRLSGDNSSWASPATSAARTDLPPIASLTEFAGVRSSPDKGKQRAMPDSNY